MRPDYSSKMFCGERPFSGRSPFFCKILDRVFALLVCCREVELSASARVFAINDGDNDPDVVVLLMFI